MTQCRSGTNEPIRSMKLVGTRRTFVPRNCFQYSETAEGTMRNGNDCYSKNGAVLDKDTKVLCYIVNIDRGAPVSARKWTMEACIERLFW